MQLSFHGKEPSDRAALRVWAHGWAAREEGAIRPLPCGGLSLRLHPAGEPLDLRLEDGELFGEVATGACGPGYHDLLCGVLDDLKGSLVIDLAVEDPTGYFAARDGGALQETMRAWRVARGREMERALATSSGPLYFGLPAGSEAPDLGGRRRVVTATAAYAAREWRDANDAMERGEQLADHVPWWRPGHDAAYWRGRALTCLHTRLDPGRIGREQRLREAIWACEEARALDPGVRLPLIRVATAHEELGDLERAAALGEEALAEDLGSADVTAWLAGIYQRLGRIDEAARLMAGLSHRCPAFPSVAYEAGLLLNELARFDEALVHLERACANGPRRARHHGERAVALAALGRYEDALAALDRALELSPVSPDGWLDRAQLLEALGRPDDAEASRARAAEIQASLEGEAPDDARG